MRYMIHSLLLLLSLFAVEAVSLDGKQEVTCMTGHEVGIEKMIGEKN